MVKLIFRLLECKLSFVPSLFSFHFSLMSMLKEYQAIQESIPTVVQPLMKPLCDYVERVLKPGLGSLTWTSFNIESCEEIWKIPFLSEFFLLLIFKIFFMKSNIVDF